jgi:hypothetical protein
MQNESTKAPPGKLFYIVTDPPTANNRCYLYHVKYENSRITKGSKFARFKRGCRAFDDRLLADSICRFLSELEGRQFYVVLEAGAR